MSFAFVYVNADLDKCTLVLYQQHENKQGGFKTLFSWRLHAQNSPFYTTAVLFKINIFSSSKSQYSHTYTQYSLGFERKHTAYLVHLLIHKISIVNIYGQNIFKE